MSSKYLVVALVWFSCASVFADVDATKNDRSAASATNASQVQSDSKLRVGVLGGLSVSNATLTGSIAAGQPSQSYTGDSRTGFSGGVFAEYALLPYLTLSPELLYTQRGGTASINTTISGTAVSALINYRYDVIELPLLLESKFGNETIKALVFAGPSLAVAVNRTATATATVAGAPGTPTNSSPSDFNTLNLSIHAGAGGELTLTPKISLQLTGRYVFGLTDVDTDSTSTTRLSGWLFMTGVSIGL